MPEYEIIVRCRECNREHPVLMKIHLDHGPKGKQSVAEFFHGRMMPPQVRSIQWHKALCLKTGKTFKLEAADRILLVPPAAGISPRRPLSKLSDSN
jgi:hypothetical protein